MVVEFHDLFVMMADVEGLFTGFDELGALMEVLRESLVGVLDEALVEILPDVEEVAVQEHADLFESVVVEVVICQDWFDGVGVGKFVSVEIEFVKLGLERVEILEDDGFGIGDLLWCGRISVGGIAVATSQRAGLMDG
jgi:hypothetical protein